MNKPEKSDNRFPVKEPIHPSYYVPTNSEQALCQEIAIQLEETDMRYILARLHQLGIHEIERAYGTVKEYVAMGTCRNPRKYFNALLTKALKKKRGENYGQDDLGDASSEVET